MYRIPKSPLYPCGYGQVHGSQGTCTTVLYFLYSFWCLLGTIRSAHPCRDSTLDLLDGSIVSDLSPTLHSLLESDICTHKAPNSTSVDGVMVPSSPTRYSSITSVVTAGTLARSIFILGEFAVMEDAKYTL